MSRTREIKHCGKIAEQLHHHGIVVSGGLFRSITSRRAENFAVTFGLSEIARRAVATRLGRADAAKARKRYFVSTVGAILRMGAKPQVGFLVVQRITIDMIKDLTIFSIHHEPMKLNLPTVYIGDGDESAAQSSTSKPLKARDALKVIIVDDRKKTSRKRDKNTHGIPQSSSGADRPRSCSADFITV